MNKVADIAITGKFRNNGQVCISPNRFYIQENRKDEFVSAFMERAKKLKTNITCKTTFFIIIIFNTLNISLNQDFIILYV